MQGDTSTDYSSTDTSDDADYSTDTDYDSDYSGDDYSTDTDIPETITAQIRTIPEAIPIRIITIIPTEKIIRRMNKTSE